MLHQLRKYPVVVTFSTTPYRINELQNVITALTQQKLATPIYLSIPHVFLRDNLEYIIPDWLQNNSKVTILRTQDYGPATKILGLLEQVTLDPETIIITVDDDVIYPNNTILHLAHKARVNPSAAVGTIGANFDYDTPKHLSDTSQIGLTEVRRANAKVTILKGYGAVAYKRKFFKPEIFHLMATAQPCRQADDLLLSYHLATQGIARLVLNHQHLNAKHIGWQTMQNISADALHNLYPRPLQKHRACLAYLQQLDPTVEF